MPTTPRSHDGLAADAGLSLPPRSRLYQLPLLGRKTPEVESMSGYLMRVAAAHGLPVGALIAHHLRPLLAGEGSLSAKRSLEWKTSHLVNGTGAVARDAVRILGAQTLQEGLRDATLLPWSEVLPARSLLRRTRAWCPPCYADARDAGRPVHDVLLWTIRVVTRCPVHGTPLVDRCPVTTCTAPHRVLAWDARPGHCTRCQAWLGARGPVQASTVSAMDDASDAWDLWVARAVGDILAAGPSLILPPTRDVLTAAFQPYEEPSTKRHTRRVAHHVAERSKTVYSWKSGQRIPSLPTLLRTCAHLGVAPVRILTGDDRVRVGAGTEAGSTTLTPPVPAPLTSTYARFDSETVRVTLQEVLDRADDPPLSMSAVAAHLGRHHSDLQARFPDLCGAISARYLAHRRERGQRTRQEGCAQIRAATIAVHAQGIYPSEERVCAFLGNPSAIRQAGAHAQWRATLRELGHTSR